MAPPLDSQQDGSDDAVLEVQLRQIRRFAFASGAIWIIATAVLTVWLSEQMLSGYVAAAASDAERDARAIAAVVERVFHELAAIPGVLSSNEQLRALARRYSAEGKAFADLPAEQRAARLENDPAVKRLNERLTAIRNELNYDLVYVLDAHGVRIVSSEWDQPLWHYLRVGIQGRSPRPRSPGRSRGT